MFGNFDKEYQMELLKKAEREEGREEGTLITNHDAKTDQTGIDFCFTGGRNRRNVS